MTEDSTPRADTEHARAAPASGGPLPGRRLREARELQGLQREDVAERLHIQPAQVEALENDDYTRFSAPIFISGYLRSYARLLGLDPDTVVKALERQGLEQPPILSELTARMPSVRQRRGSSPRVRAALISVGTVVFLLLLWLSLRPVDTGVSTVDETPAAPAAPPVSAPAATPEAVVPTTVPPEPAAAPAAVPAPAPVPEPEEEEIREEPPPATNEPMDELVLRFSGESWVEVTDITGRRMAYRMANFPDVLRLRGLAPFDILLGNARNVSIDYNGEPYGNVPIGRTNVASFRLGGSNDEGMKKDASQKPDPET